MLVSSEEHGGCWTTWINAALLFIRDLLQRVRIFAKEMAWGTFLYSMDIPIWL